MSLDTEDVREANGKATQLRAEWLARFDRQRREGSQAALGRFRASVRAGAGEAVAKTPEAVAKLVKWLRKEHDAGNTVSIGLIEPTIDTQMRRGQHANVYLRITDAGHLIAGMQDPSTGNPKERVFDHFGKLVTAEDSEKGGMALSCLVDLPPTGYLRVSIAP